MSAAHVHPNPGYHDYSAGLRRAATNPQLLNSRHYCEDTTEKMVAPDAELSRIKDWSKRVWSGKDICETTYQFQYPEKNLDERTKSAPTDRERLNKPHPKQHFLTNRLHYVPGYHNADAALSKSAYQPDAMCGSGEQEYRKGIRTKYDGGISDGAVRQYAPKEEDEITKWNKTLPPNDAWMATNSQYGGRPSSKLVLKSLDDAIAEAAHNQAAETASHTRYLRLAGPEERERIHRALDASHSLDKIPNMMVPHQIAGNLGSQRQRDKSNFQGNPHKPLYRFPRPRGDFLIHPVWPPSMWHHRIPGFRADPPANGVLSSYDRYQQRRLNGVY